MKRDKFWDLQSSMSLISSNHFLSFVTRPQSVRENDRHLNHESLIVLGRIQESFPVQICSERRFFHCMQFFQHKARFKTMCRQEITLDNTTTTTQTPSLKDCMTIPRKEMPDIVSVKGRRRRARFSPLVSVSTDTHSTHDVSLWYNRVEIFAFKEHIKEQARNFFLENKTNEQSNELPRGLEAYNLERRLHRHRTIQCTLSAYRKGMKAEDVAKVAHACGVWNNGIALIQACKDYCEVYQPSMISQVPQLSSNPPKFPFALKRSEKSSRGNGRRVRHRKS